MLTLLIGSKKVTVRGEVGSSFDVLPVVYENDGKLYQLRMSTELPVLDGVEILLMVWHNYFIRLSVPTLLQTAILNFMLFKHVVKDDCFDCYSFACEVGRVPEHDKKFWGDYWELKPLLLPKVGDIVFFISQINKRYFNFYHAAVYIGFGRYLSVWGAGGQFEVATRSDMKRDYGAQKVYLATPR